MNYRVKRESNDSLRQRFVDVTVPQAEFFRTESSRLKI